MKKLIVLISILALGLGLSFAATTTAAPADITGTWIGKAEIPDVGIDELTMVLKKDKDAYSGTILDAMEMIALGTEIKVVEFRDDVLTVTFPLADGGIVTSRLKVAGDKMTGQWEHSAGGSGTLEFTRKK
jgi:hypothetical protein